MKSNPLPELGSNRILALDVFRGITMFLLIAEGALLYRHLLDAGSEGILHSLALQFHHHPWHGMRFWDLIQPYFMFIVGVAMPFSYANRVRKGQSKAKITRHILIRCLILFFLGIILHCGYNGKLVFELWNVLTQLSFTILLAYLFMNRSLGLQIALSIGVILLSDLLYRFTSIPGYDQPFVKGENFGSFMDMVLMGKTSGGGWVAINALPTAAHTIRGVITGKILQQEGSGRRKIRIFLVGALLLLIVGYMLDLTGISPVIKRICTSSFIFISGGWTLLSFAIIYFITDLRSWTGWTGLFLLFGTNPIFIYMFSQTIGHQWMNDFVLIFTSGGLTWMGLPDPVILIINSLVVLALQAYILRFMFRNKVFIKILGQPLSLCP
jgi:predicted acyltransferase